MNESFIINKKTVTIATQVLFGIAIISSALILLDGVNYGKPLPIKITAEQAFNIISKAQNWDDKYNISDKYVHLTLVHITKDGWIYVVDQETLKDIESSKINGGRFQGHEYFWVVSIVQNDGVLSGDIDATNGQVL